MANQLEVRTAQPAERGAITRLLRQARYSHYHADWSLPVDWLGSPTFLVVERPGEVDEPLRACIAAAADPPPAAWVRVAAVLRGEALEPLLEMMLSRLIPVLQREGVTELGWLAIENWPNEFLARSGFRQIHEIQTFVKEDLALPAFQEADVTIRPARDADLPELVALEEAAFVPLWRHSLSALQKARPHAISFDVAEREGKIVAFQYSTPGNRGGAHLARITVAPDVQRQRVGSTLLKAAIEGYRQRGVRQISLNTQSDNIPSQLLYRKFGFHQEDENLPVWSLLL